MEDNIKKRKKCKRYLQMQLFVFCHKIFALSANIGRSREQNAQDNNVYNIKKKDILCTMTSSVETCIIGIQTTGINGTRDIWAKT